MLDQSAETQPATAEQRTHSAEMSAAPRTNSPHVGERYELQGVLAKGGMGAVHKAWDHVLQRPVAVKLLHEHAVSTFAIKRFDYEAHITGRLQHPSIPPVHDRGARPDGTPFLVMKLIRGSTLDALLKAPGDAPLNVLGIFEAIAQAIGYAHSHGVIHRDLKPLNVMVGAFGEVQVMDWGLAKFRGDAEAIAAGPATDSTFHDPRTWDEVDRTMAGAALGTPAYMPPEQAIGLLHEVTERSDVFGLGGILCAMLTGQPPFLGTDAECTRKLAAQGKVSDAFARLDQSGGEPEVIALAKRCLAVEPAERPANGNEVATIVANLRQAAADRARQAEIGQARAETRRRALTWAAAAVLTVLSAGAAVSWVQWSRAVGAEHETAQQLAKTVEAQQSTAAQLEKTQTEEKRALAAEATANAKTKEAEATLLVVRERTDLLSEAYGDFVFGIQTKLENRPGTQELRRDLLETARKGQAKILDEARRHGTPDHTLVWSHLRMGDVEQNLGNTLAARKEYQAGHALAKARAAADPQGVQAQRDLNACSDRLGDAAFYAGRLEEALSFYRQALAVRDRLAAADPQNEVAQRDLGLSFSTLGSVSLLHGQVKDARAYHQQALAIRERLAAADPQAAQAQRDVCSSYDRLGDVMVLLGQPKDALALHEKGLAIRDRLAAADRGNAQAQRDVNASYDKLGGALLLLGRMKEAEAYYQKGLAVRGRLAEDDPRNAQAQRGLSVSFSNLGDAKLQLGQVAEALAFYQKYHTVCERLAAVDPNNAQAQRDLGISYDRLADVTVQVGRAPEAVAFYKNALAIRDRLAAADRSNAQAQRDLSISFERLGDVSLQLSRAEDALAFHQKALALRERLAAADPDNPQAFRDLNISHDRLGDALLQLNRSPEAEAYYRKGLAVRERLAAADPTNPAVQRNLSISFDKLGDVSRRLGETREAIGFYQAGRAIREELAAADPNNIQALRDLSYSYNTLGDLSSQLNRFKEARSFYQKGLAVRERLAAADPTNGRDVSISYDSLGDLALRQGEAKEALALYQTGLAICERRAAADPKNATAQRDVSVSLDKVGDATLQLDQAPAAAVYQKSLAIRERLAAADPTNPQAQRDVGISFDHLGVLSWRTDQPAEAWAFYHKGLAVRERAADAHPTNVEAQGDLLNHYCKLADCHEDEHEHATAAEWLLKAKKRLAQFRQRNAAAHPEERLGRRTVGEWAAHLDRQLETCERAEKAVADIAFVFRQPTDQISDLLDVRVKTLIKRKQTDEAIATAGRFAAWAETQREDLGLQRYNAACVHALCAAAAGADREKLVDQAVALLHNALAAGYFDPDTIDNFKEDEDFDGIRAHPKVTAFQAELDKLHETAPPPRERK